MRDSTWVEGQLSGVLYFDAYFCLNRSASAMTALLILGGIRGLCILQEHAGQPRAIFEYNPRTELEIDEFVQPVDTLSHLLIFLSTRRAAGLPIKRLTLGEVKQSYSARRAVERICIGIRPSLTHCDVKWLSLDKQQDDPT